MCIYMLEGCYYGDGMVRVYDRFMSVMWVNAVCLHAMVDGCYHGDGIRQTYVSQVAERYLVTRWIGVTMAMADPCQ